MTRMAPPGGLKDTALVMRLRNTWPRRPSMPTTMRPSRSGRCGKARMIRGPVSGRVAPITSASVSRRSARSTVSLSARESSASNREASEMSLISRSRRCTSSRMIDMSFFCCSGSTTRETVSTALRKEVRGFLISCATSAAKPSMASSRDQSASVISLSAPERSPISSWRLVKSGISKRRPLPYRTRTAAKARRRIGRARVLAK